MQSTAQVSAGVNEDQKPFSWAWLDANLRIVKCRGQRMQPFGLGVGSFLSRDPFVHVLNDVLELQNADNLGKAVPAVIQVPCELPLWGRCVLTFAWYQKLHQYFLTVRDGSHTPHSDDILFDYLSINEQSSNAGLAATDAHPKRLKESNPDEPAPTETEALISVAAHDLRAPLRAIHNLATWSLEDAPDGLPQEMSEYLRQIDRQALRASQLVTDMQQYANLARSQDSVSDFDLGTLINEVVTSVPNPDNLCVHVDCAHVKVPAPRSAFSALLTELLDNAIKFHDRKDGVITLHGQVNGDTVSIEVVDDGPGIDAEYQHKIFDPFQKLESYDDVAGSGLGLAAVKKIANIYNAPIHVISPLENGRGTSFRVSWPVCQLTND